MDLLWYQFIRDLVGGSNRGCYIARLQKQKWREVLLKLRRLEVPSMIKIYIS